MPAFGQVQLCCMIQPISKETGMRERKTKKTGSAPLKTALSPGSKGRKFTAPIKIKSKPSLERIYGVQQPQTTATLQLSQTPGVKLHTPAHCALTVRLTGWLNQLRLSVKVKRFDSRACWRWEEGSFSVILHGKVDWISCCRAFCWLTRSYPIMCGQLICVLDYTSLFWLGPVTLIALEIYRECMFVSVCDRNTVMKMVYESSDADWFIY